MLRMSHVAQAKGIPSGSLLLSSKVRVCDDSEKSNDEDQERGKVIWEVFVRHILSHKGPYWATKHGKIEARIVRIACLRLRFDGMSNT